MEACSRTWKACPVKACPVKAYPVKACPVKACSCTSLQVWKLAQKYWAGWRVAPARSPLPQTPAADPQLVAMGRPSLQQQEQQQQWQQAPPHGRSGLGFLPAAAAAPLLTMQQPSPAVKQGSSSSSSSTGLGSERGYAAGAEGSGGFGSSSRAAEILPRPLGACCQKELRGWQRGLGVGCICICEHLHECKCMAGCVCVFVSNAQYGSNSPPICPP